SRPARQDRARQPPSAAECEDAAQRGRRNAQLAHHVEWILAEEGAVEELGERRGEREWAEQRMAQGGAQPLGDLAPNAWPRPTRRGPLRNAEPPDEQRRGE